MSAVDLMSPANYKYMSANKLYYTTKYSGILFDMDGTVLDSEGLFDKAQLRFLKENDILVSSEDLSEFKGMSYKHFYPRFMSKFNITGAVDGIRLKLRTYLHEIMETELEYIEGFEEFYNSYILGHQVKVGIVTNTTRLSYQKIDQCVGIGNYFPYSLTASESREPKPSPVPFIQAMDELKLTSDKTLIIEDSQTGLLSAVGSGAQVIGITTSLSKQDILNIDNSIHVVDTYQDIADYLENC
jgi:HAD superfamily hydrolase (TIGR01509 family)